MTKYVVAHTESEAGWGQRHDGYSGPFDTYEEAKNYQRRYNEKYNNKTEVPAWYIVAEDPEIYTGQRCDYNKIIS